MRIFLCDLTHVSQIVASEIFPLNIGFVATYCKKKFDERVDISLFKYPHDLVQAFRENRPDIIAFSNYIWNLDLGYSLASKIKKEYPDTPVIFGGPNYPSVPSEQENWLRSRPNIDMHIYKDAEVPFSKIIERLLKNEPIEEIKKRGLPSIHAISSDNMFYSGPLAERIKELDILPSPYLEKFFDNFFDGKLMCMVQTNRGCPFACTFCVEGISYYNKINRFSLERVSEELEYMAIHQKGNRNLFIADSNFGMYKEDVAIAETIARVNRKSGFPEYIYATTGKNQKERILDCTRLLNGLLRVSATVQSLDKDVLKEVKRTNISSQKLIELAEAASESNANTYADVILALPGDSKKAHFETIKQLVETGIDYLTLFTSILLDSTEMASLENRKKYGMQTRFKVLPRCFGIYPFGAAEFISAETEEVCVANNTLSFEDYLECRLFDLTVGIFYNDRIFYELNAFLKLAGVSIYDWLLTIHHSRNEFPKSIQNVYRQYLFETESELWKDRSELENFIKTSPEIIQKYIKGELGNNVFYTARAMVLVNCVEDLHIVAFDVAQKIVSLINPFFYKRYEFYLKELQRYSLLKKVNPLSSNSEEISQFYFNFLELENLKFLSLPEKKLPQPISLRFSHTADQIDHLLRQLKVYGSSKVGMARLLGKNPVKKFYRTPSAYFPSDISTDHDHRPADKVWQDYS